MIIESGVVIFLGMMFLGLKLEAKTSLTLLGYPLALDFSVSAVAFLLHYGTFSGAMSAATAGLMCSGFTTAARYAFGYIKAGEYFPGHIWKLDVTKLK